MKFTKSAVSFFRGQILALGYVEEDDTLKKRNKERFIHVDVFDETVRITVSKNDRTDYRILIFGNLEESFDKVAELDDASFDLDNWTARNPGDIEKARMIQEIRTFKLEPNDKFIVIVKDDVDQAGMESLAKAMQQWVGEKGAHRVLVMSSAQVIKVSDE